MAAGDVQYTYLMAGSTATSAAGAHNLFGVYGGLSALSASEVIIVQLNASGADMRFSAGAALPATNNVGTPLFTTDALYDLPPMKVGVASQITIANLTATNCSPNWSVWIRTP